MTAALLSSWNGVQAGWLTAANTDDHTLAVPPQPHPSGRHAEWSNTIGFGLAFWATLLFLAPPTSAKILTTLGQAVSSQVSTLTVGSGLEYQSDSEQTQYDFPFLLERNLTKSFMLTVEPNFIYLRDVDGSSISGFGELETSLTLDVLDERRNRPGLSALGIVKWPTASHSELGTGKTDYSLGLIASKEFVHFDADLNVIYTWVGSPPETNLQNTLEVALAGNGHLSRHIDLEGEFLYMNAPGRSHGAVVTGGALPGETTGNEFSLTLGLAELIGESLKLEQGVNFQSDGSWQAIVSWEWSLGGGD